MVRRHKAEAFERFLDEYRGAKSWAAHQILADPHFARIFRAKRERRARLALRGNHEGGWSDAGWAHRAYGRKGKNKWRVR